MADDEFKDAMDRCCNTIADGYLADAAAKWAEGDPLWTEFLVGMASAFFVPEA